MRFYETMARSVRDFTPLQPGRVTMYTCGPTVYRYAHIGNLRTFITADLLRRALEFEGYEVRQVMNITDVGHMTDDTREAGQDKMLLAADDEGLAPLEIAEKYTKAFLSHTGAVNIKPASLYPRATDHIPDMLTMCETLIGRGHAYEVEGSVYFDVDSFPGYGGLSHNTRDKLQAGHRIEEVDTAKRHHYDFTLWRAAGPRRLMKWPSPWGEGYPGWHIECSAMSIRHLGEQFDVHTGGSDLIFPHHEDEIAQSEGTTGHKVVQSWLHGHHLLAEGRKMAKSAGNYYILDDLAARGIDPLAFRYLVLQVRYRAQTNFTWEALEAAGRGMAKLRKQMAEWASGPVAGLSAEAAKLDTRFAAAVSDDLDTPEALVAVSDLAAAPMTPAEKFHLLKKWDAVLGLDLDADVASTSDLPPGAAEKIQAREKARASKDWPAADRLRDELAEQGVDLIDTPEGSRWTVTH
jgi:cysteinyl-tRNA synthetase